MDKGIVAAASIMTLFSLYFAYSPEATQEYFAKKGKQTLVIRGDGEDVKIKPLRGIRWKEVSAEDPQISFESTVVFTGTKSNAQIVTPEKTEISMDEQTIASFIIKNQIEGLELQKGYISINLRVGKFTVFGKKPIVLTGKGEVKLEKTKNGVKLTPQSGEVKMIEMNNVEKPLPEEPMVLIDKKNIELLSPKQFETLVTADKRKIKFQWSEEISDLIIYTMTGKNQKEFLRKEKIKEENIILFPGNYVWSASVGEQKWDGKIEIIKALGPMLEISYTDKGEERIFQVVDINGSSPAIKSILYEGLSEKNQSLLLKETRAALQFSTKDYPKLRKLKVSFRYISGEKGPTKVYDIPLKQKEPEVVKEIPAPKEMTLKPEVTKKEVKEIKKKVVQKKKVVKKAPPSFKYFPYAFSGMDAFFATQLRNDAKSTTISSPFLGGGALIQHRKYPKNYLDVRAYYNKVLKTDTRQLNQPDKINLAAELKLYQQNKWKTDINYYFKYVRHSYLESADPEEINFGMQNVYLLGFGFSPALTQDFWIFEDNLFYLYYEVSSDGDSLAPVVEFESVFKSFQFYEHKFTPFLEMGMKSLSGSAYDQIIYTLFVGSYF